MAGLTLTELVAIAAADADLRQRNSQALGGLYGLTCTAMGIGLLMVGVAMWRARTSEGWRRGIVLALGVWVWFWCSRRWA